MIDLEDARDWLATAVRELERGDAAAAVHATCTAMRHAEDALEELTPSSSLARTDARLLAE